MSGQPRAPAPSSQSDFIFIDSSLQKDATNEAVKVHAMRKWHRRRHVQKGSQAYPTTGGELQLWDQGAPQSAVSQPRHTLRRDKVHTAVATTTNSTLGAGPDNRHSAFVFDPYDILGAGRSDPFGQYPYRKSDHVNFLVDFYMTARAGILSPELLSLYRGDPAAFASFLAVVSQGFSMVTAGRPGISVDVAEGQAIRLVNSRIGHSSQNFNSSTLLAISLIANLEELRGNLVNAKLHWGGLQRAIEAYGGLQKLFSSRSLYATIFWHEALVNTSRDHCLGQLDPGVPWSGVPLNRQVRSSTPTTIHQKKIPPKREGSSFSLEYGQLFKSITLQTADVRFAAAEFRLPASIPRSFGNVDASLKHRVPRRMVTMLASLLYLTCVRVDNTPEIFAIFTLEVHRALTQYADDYVACGEELLHALLKCVGPLDPQRCIYYSCRLSRLLCAARSLPRDSWDTSCRVLSYFLGVPHGVSSLAELNNWKDILGRTGSEESGITGREEATGL